MNKKIREKNVSPSTAKYYCNPININYRYQFNKKAPENQELQVWREAADPSMIFFKGKYYIFASMTLGVWISDDLIEWENHRLPDSLPLYDYAPDVRVVGEYVYFCASKISNICNYYRTKDVENGPYEEIPGTFAFWDPNLFLDDDKRLYFYWGCTNTDPIWGVEVDPVTMHPLREKKALIYGNAFTNGFERVGEDHSLFPKTEDEIESVMLAYLQDHGLSEDPQTIKKLTTTNNPFSQHPYIEGSWMTKYHGKYYLQYACPGTEFNSYGDGVYVSNSPLGPLL